MLQYTQMTQEIDTYWQEDIKLFTGIFHYYRNKPQPVRAKIHSSEEQYFNGEDEIISISPHKGKRTYVMIHPYIEEPNIILTIGIPSGGYADTAAIGKVQKSRVEGFRQVQIGNCQAWYYHDAKILVLWECYVDFHHRSSPKPAQDENMRQLWKTIEHHLHTKFSEAERIITPYSDPIYPTKPYQTFLKSLGYEQLAPAAYGKLL